LTGCKGWQERHGCSVNLSTGAFYNVAIPVVD